jgi:hypothetical protein
MSRLPFSCVLGVLVRILAIRIDDDLPDAQRRWLPPQFEDGLEHDLIGLAGPCHPKQRGFLAEEISGRDRNGYAVDLLKRRWLEAYRTAPTLTIAVSASACVRGSR